MKNIKQFVTLLVRKTQSRDVNYISYFCYLCIIMLLSVDYIYNILYIYLYKYMLYTLRFVLN